MFGGLFGGGGGGGGGGMMGGGWGGAIGGGISGLGATVGSQQGGMTPWNYQPHLMNEYYEDYFDKMNRGSKKNTKNLRRRWEETRDIMQGYGKSEKQRLGDSKRDANASATSDAVRSGLGNSTALGQSKSMNQHAYDRQMTQLNDELATMKANLYASKPMRDRQEGPYYQLMRRMARNGMFLGQSPPPEPGTFEQFGRVAGSAAGGFFGQPYAGGNFGAWKGSNFD